VAVGIVEKVNSVVDASLLKLGSMMLYTSGKRSGNRLRSFLFRKRVP
jgi:hypothetical protein